MARTFGGMRILVVEDSPELRRSLERHLRRAGAEVLATESIDVAVAALSEAPGYRALVLDMGLPGGRGFDVLDRLPKRAQRPAVIVITGEATLETAIGALRVGAVDYLMKPFSLDALDAALARVTKKQSGSFAVDIPPPTPLDDWRAQYAPSLLGHDREFLRALEVLARVAPTDCSVLVQGETGTGKELVARALHVSSGRGSKPFVAVNCAAIPEPLMESELFGHARGAFTGADKARTGRFGLADQGTLFLDEIGELALPTQAKLLRALQEKEITPLGDSQAQPLDVRVVAATHCDLERMVDERRFRADLLYRLDVIRVALPPLRKRPTDIPLLVAAIVEQICRRRSIHVTGVEPPAMQVLAAQPWPGNVRQLQNTLERILLLRTAGPITLEDVAVAIPGGPAHAPTGDALEPVLPDDGLDLREAVERYEGMLIRRALERTGWNKNRAAALLRMNRTTLVEKLKKRGWSPVEDPDEP